MSLLTWSYVAYWIGAVADWYTTKRGLASAKRHGINVREVNPFFNALRKLGLTMDATATLIKTAAFLWFYFRDYPPSVLFLFAGVQLLAAGSNRWGWLSKLYAKIKGR
jgi:hypothetical protein